MCPKCRNFTTAPVGQKRRRCSYCGTIINIAKASCALFDSPEKASAAVKAFNASRGGDEFENAVETSKERIQAFLPSEKINAGDIATSSHGNLPSGKRARLMSLLEKEAKNKPCSLDRIESLCTTHQLDWPWVELQLNGLANSGVVIFPRPWTVKLVPTSMAKPENVRPDRDVSNEIIDLLRGSSETIHIDEIIHHFERDGITASSVEKSLERLMRKGEVFEPKPGKVQLI